MLGEKIYDATGRRTGTRVLAVDPVPKVETSFEAKGKLLGLDTTEWVTYWSVMRPDGTLYGEAQGVGMTQEGGYTWTAQGLGRFTGGGSAVSFRGAIYFRTATEKLARLNTVAGVFEYEADEDGNSQAQIWEWK